VDERRTWLPFGVVAALVITGLAVVLVVNRGSDGSPRCASPARATSPLVSPSRFSEDEHLATLSASVGRMRPLVGTVRAGVGFNYGQWLHLYGVGEGLIAFTKNNPGPTMLDGESLKPRWSLRPASKRIAWDASASRFVLLDLSSKSRVRVGSYDLRTGREVWCVGLSTHHRDGQPVSTTFLEGGDLLVALPTADDRLGLARLSGMDGHVLWSTGLVRAGRADFLAQIDANRAIVGGVEAFRLAQPGAVGPRQGFEVVSLGSGERVPPYAAPARDLQHLVGLHAGHPLVLIRKGAETRLESQDVDGLVLWSKRLPEATVDVALRGAIVLVRSARELSGYSADGAVLWRRPIPQDRTYIPYGYTLDQMPMLDDRHLLLPTTTSLQALDVRTGRSRDYALPTDGVSTTSWPYQLVSTDQLIGVVTNTGAVVADREP